MKTDRFEPDLEAWDPWTPEQIAQRLSGLTVPWCVVGGWSLDLFLGRVTREHDDLEIAVPAGRFIELMPRFTGFEHFAVGSGFAWPLDSDVTDESHQTWVREPETGAWRVDIFREPHEGDTWICRRNPDIRLPYSDVIGYTPAGIPYAAPELTLLFKAKATRAKDQIDFETVLPHLAPASQQWLHDALQMTHPEHPWIDRLGVNR